MPEFDFAIFTDGGSGAGGIAAGAAIVEDLGKKTRHCLAVALGEGTNNEAEITASLLAFSAVRLICGENSDGVRLRWVCDSEYVLKGATGYIFNWQRNGWKTADKKPVKNQGLWQAYLCLSAGFKITPEHVRGHTGHPENESCDTAVQWVKKHDEDLFADKLIAQAKISTAIGQHVWTCLDGREFMRAMRGELASEPEQKLFCNYLRQSFAGNTARTDISIKKDPIEPILAHLKQAFKAAQLQASTSPRAAELAEKIEKLLQS
jgi:ribonuclease HI